ncbi:MAG: winged helix-turn-helix domain-containing protein, partial [Myxococcota bacterium]|nr:winged helix-turn-helix domain-containing protein [Myxococcota bacterium]
MTFIEAAAEVLRQAGKPLHYKEITELAIGKNLLSHVGKTPEVTMSHRLTAAIKKDDKDIPIVKVKPGVFALREWEEKRGRKALSSVTAEDRKADESTSSDDASVEVNALEIEAALRGAQARVDAAVAAGGEDGDGDEDAEDRNTPVSGDEARRADLAASGADLFDDEDDDDQPILAPSQQGVGQQSDGAA